ncbi:MAG: YbhB/YbcL family Raf kinase inhibitor-like protein [Candidatus Nanohaloarchaea archaeon]
MRLTSPAFNEEDDLPEKYCSTREDINPPLEIEEVPEKAESLVLIVDDPDAVKMAGKIWEHWTVWNISPETKEIEEDSVPENAVQGKTDFRKHDYAGPNPPEEGHTGRFQLYAIDKELDLDEESTREDVLDAIEDHVIEKGVLKAGFEPVD